MNLIYPPAADGERVQAQITTDFFGFPKTRGGVLQRYAPTWVPQTPHAWRELAQQLGLALGTLGFFAVLVLRRRSRVLYVAVVLALLFSMIATPVIDSVKAAAFFERQAAEQAQPGGRAVSPRGSGAGADAPRRSGLGSAA